jgi:iron complex outermembrane receptor protein
MNKPRPCTPLLLVAVSWVVLQNAMAHAQSIDYGAMQDMLGEPITASVTGSPQRASEAPANLVIITQDDIRRSGATTIPDILQFVTGVDIRRYGLGASQLGINGYDSYLNPRLLVMVDGRQTYSDDFGYVAWNALPVQLSEIRQIEVIKGPASALFGFNAASGVVNIITFDPLYDKVNTATLRGGNHAYGEGEAVGTAQFGGTAGIRISVGGLTANDYTNRPADATVISPPRDITGNIDGRWQVTPDILLRASAGAGDSHEATDASFYVNQTNKLDYFRAGMAANTRIGTIDFDAYRNDGNITYGPVANVRTDTVVLKASDILKIGATNTVRVGLEYRNNSLTSSVVNGTVSYDNYAANAMWEWQISPMLTLTNAVRLDHLVLNFAGTPLAAPGHSTAAYDNTTITQPSFNSGLVIKVSDVDTIRLTAARGLQIPSLLDFGIQIPVGPGVIESGSPSLQPTSVWNAELGYVHSFPALGMTVGTSVFFQRNTNLIANPSDGPLTLYSGGALLQPDNEGSSNEIGGEVGLHGTTATGFRYNASYRYASISEDISTAAYSAITPFTHPANGTPFHVVILGGGYTLGKWEMDGALRWQSGYTDYTIVGAAYEPFHMSDNVTLNARLAYQVTENLTLAGVAQQYNVSRLLIPTGSTIERLFLASATVHF